MKKPVIEFENFTWKYNAQTEPTLKNLNLTIYEGEKILICGPSGGGKSTVGHCLNGLIPFSFRGEGSGSLRICGKEAKKLSLFDLSKMVGTVLQDADGQFVGLTVAEDIAFALENDCVEQAAMRERVRTVAAEVGVDRHLSHSPDELSGGQKQRVSLAGVMVNGVPIYLFDEPLANLDPATGKQAIELIDELQKSHRATVVIIEHRLEDVLHRDVDRIILIHEGRILADSTPDELLSTELLRQCGVREPLYIAAMKQAGLTIRPDMLPHSIRTLKLTESERAVLREYYEREPERRETPEAQELLRVENLTFGYQKGQPVLRDVSLKIHRGEMMAIVGKNGAGKSTFSKLLCGFETPDSGKILLEGADMSDLSIKERADRIGYVMQNPNQMICKVKIFDEVALGLVCRKTPAEEIRTRVEDTLRVCGLYPFRKWPVSALSFGQKKRVTIASILALNPEMILLDEPTAGQDLRHYTEIMEFLRALNEKGVTVVMITHDMHLMLEYCPRAVMFSEGEMLADSPSYEVLTDDGLIERANLKKTSLYDLALLCGASEPRTFVRHFIQREREARK